MKGGFPARLLPPLGWLAFLAVGYSPLLGALLAATEDPWPAEGIPASPRRMALLVNSLGLSAGVALAVMVVGTLAAVALLRRRATARPVLQWLLLASIAVPPTVQALAWCEAIGELNRRWGLSLIGDWWTGAAVQAMSLLPFGTGVALAALQATDGRLLDVGRVHSTPLRLILRLALPLARPLLVCGAILVFLLSLLDYTLPSIFGVNVYAMEIFVAFSANHNVGECLLLALPLLLVAVLLLGLVAPLPRRLAQRATASFPRDGSLPVPFMVLLVLAAGLMGLALVLPLRSLGSALAAPGELARTTLASMGELGYTLAINLVAALLAVALAVVPAAWLAFGKAGRLPLWPLALLPYLLPPTLTGIGLIALWNRLAPAGLHGDSFLVVMALVSRLAPLALAVLSAWLLRLDPALVEAAVVGCRSRRELMGRILLPLTMPGLLAAGTLAFVLGLGDVGTSLLLLPPGSETLAIKTYNYLHYGGSQAAAGLCLLLMALAVGGTALPWLAWLTNRTCRRRGWVRQTQP